MRFQLAIPQYIYELGMRDNQEDSIFPQAGQATADDRLFIVCDGMGGHEKGEVASRIVCEALADYVRENTQPDTVFTDNMLTQACELAYARLDEADGKKTDKRMGTTFTFVLFHQGGCFMAHMGDSRIYHIRPSEKKILYMSKDHSLVFDLFRSGEIQFDEMKTHPRRNSITRAMMPGKDFRLSPDAVNTTDIQAGDIFYLCSDGMTEEMTEADIVGILSSDNSDRSKQQRLISATYDNHDNHSAYIIRVEKVETDKDMESYRNDEATTRCNTINYIDLNKVQPTKVKSADFESHDPYGDNGKKFPWVKVMLALILISAVGLFWFVPSLKDFKNSKVTVEKSTIKDTKQYFDPDEDVYGQAHRDSILNARKARAEKGDIIASGGKDDDTKKTADQPKKQAESKPKTTSKPAAEETPKPVAAETASQPAAESGGSATTSAPATTTPATPVAAEPAQPATPAMEQPKTVGIDTDFE